MFPAFGGLGLFGNLVSIIVLLSKDMRSNCFNNILTALNITDSLHIVFAIMEVLRVDFNGVYNYFLPHSFFPYFHYPAYRICLCASIYLIMAGVRCGSEKFQIVSVGVERFLAVCRPHHYREVQVPIFKSKNATKQFLRNKLELGLRSVLSKSDMQGAR